MWKEVPCIFFFIIFERELTGPTLTLDTVASLHSVELTELCNILLVIFFHCLAMIIVLSLSNYKYSFYYLHYLLTFRLHMCFLMADDTGLWLTRGTDSEQMRTAVLLVLSAL